MIIRISTEGQYEVADGVVNSLNQLDNEVVAACDAGDEERFRTSFKGLLDLVRREGRQLGEEELSGSELILPPPDVSLEEAKTEFTGEGLIPG